MPVIIRDVTEKYFDKVPSLRGSYLVTGEAGCGKSELLKNNFSKTYYRIRALQIFSFRRYGICFLESEDMINLLSQDASRQHFLEQLKNAKYKKLFLYIDGIDELTDI